MAKETMPGPDWNELYLKLDEIIALWIDQCGGLPSKHTVLNLMSWYYDKSHRHLDEWHRSKRPGN